MYVCYCILLKIKYFLFVGVSTEKQNRNSKMFMFSSKLRCSEGNHQFLAESQQEAVLSHFNASKLKNRKSFRYSIAWIYECLLLGIKSRKAYEHIHEHEILVLPAISTLTQYIQKIKGSYGFQPSTFACLEKKASVKDVSERQGNFIY